MGWQPSDIGCTPWGHVGVNKQLTTTPNSAVRGAWQAVQPAQACSQHALAAMLSVECAGLQNSLPLVLAAAPQRGPYSGFRVHMGRAASLVGSGADNKHSCLTAIAMPVSLCRMPNMAAGVGKCTTHCAVRILRHTPIVQIMLYAASLRAFIICERASTQKLASV